jgi:hypothetical protein
MFCSKREAFLKKLLTSVGPHPPPCKGVLDTQNDRNRGFPNQVTLAHLTQPTGACARLSKKVRSAYELQILSNL